jgi:hypothetical protein
MIVWLASWPKCGSTLARQIIQQGFNIDTFSRYEEDDFSFLFPENKFFLDQWARDPELKYKYYKASQKLYIIKTHELPMDNSPAIYIARDGRDACTSLSRYYQIPIENAIVGCNTAFGNYSGHFFCWNPLERTNTIIIKFEEMMEDPEAVMNRLATFLGKNLIKEEFVNNFEMYRNKNPHFFQSTSGKWRQIMNTKQVELFWKCHRRAMKCMNYV